MGYGVAVGDRPDQLTYNPYAFELHSDPYDTYRRLRDERPAYWNDELEFWALSRYEDVQAGFKDFTTYSSAKGIALESRRNRAQALPMMILLDPPEHTVVRKLVNRVFTSPKVAALEEETRRIVDGHLDRVVEQGECDLVADLTGPFPMDVISAVLGIAESDRPALRVDADKILVREDGSMEIPQTGLEGFANLLAYFSEDLPRRRAGEGEGLLTDLAQLDAGGRTLTDEEVLGFCILFIIAGHETTTKMVANATELLSRHPDERAKILDDPGRVPDCVEEVLRFHNSTQYMHRTATRDVEIHGETIRKDDSVLLLIGAANRDEREFGPDAGTFDIDRRPDHHMSFGYGAHFCLGAGLARMEGKVALEAIHARMPDYQVDHDRKVRFHSGNVTGWTSLPITFTPTSSRARSST